MKPDKMNFDHLLKEYIGVFGLFQIICIAILATDEIFIAFHIMGSVFLAATPDHWCKTPQISTIQALSNCSMEQILNLTIPMGKDGFESCSMYKRNYSALLDNPEFSCSSASLLAESLGNDTETCTEWYYDTAKHGDTITTQWDFVCDRSWMKATISSIYIAGMGIGGFISAWFSDRFGRKKVILVAGLLNMVASLGSTFSPLPAVYYFCRFFHAGFLMGSATAMFVLGSEMVGPDWRVFVGASFFIVWGFAYMGLSGIAYGMRYYSWKDLNLVLILPEIFYLILVFFIVPESPRWLYVNKRNEEANVVVRRMAKVNKAQLPEVLDIVESEEDNSKTTVLDLFKTPKIRMMTFILAINWAANAFIYYGLSLNTSDLGGNPYINFLISGAVEIPAYVFQIWACGVFGRIRPYIFSMLFGGVVLLLTTGIPPGQEVATITLSMMGKFFITATFGMIWTYAPEAYPTCIRNQGLMTSAIGARLASILSPYIALLAKVNRILPFLIYGISAFIAGCLFIYLPETKGRPLTQTIPEGEEAVSKYRIKIKEFCKKPTVYDIEDKFEDEELQEPLNANYIKADHK